MCLLFFLSISFLFILFIMNVNGAGIAVTVTECFDCKSNDCSSSIVCQSYACDGACRLGQATPCSGAAGRFNCKAQLTSSPSVVQLGYDYYGSSCSSYLTNSLYSTAACYDNGVGGSSYLNVLGVNYAPRQQVGSKLQLCLSGFLCGVDATTTAAFVWGVDVGENRPFFTTLPPMTQIKVKIIPTVATQRLILRGHPDGAPTATDNTFSLEDTLPVMVVNFCSKTALVPDDYYFTVSLPTSGAVSASPVTFSIQLDLLILSASTCITTTTAKTTTAMVTAATTIPLTTTKSGATILSSFSKIDTTLPTTTTTAATATCLTGTKDCQCRTLGLPCNSPLTCEFVNGVQRCQCSVGTLGCPCRTTDPRCDGEQQQQMCDNNSRICVMASGVTLAPTPAPTFSLRQQCAAGNCSACVGCESCLFGGRCGFCVSSGACVSAIPDCPTKLLTGDWRTTCLTDNNGSGSTDSSPTLIDPALNTTQAAANSGDTDRAIAYWVAPLVVGLVLIVVSVAVVCLYKRIYCWYYRTFKGEYQCVYNEECWKKRDKYGSLADLQMHKTKAHSTRQYLPVPSDANRDNTPLDDSVFLAQQQQQQQNDQYDILPLAAASVKSSAAAAAATTKTTHYASPKDVPISATSDAHYKEFGDAKLLTQLNRQVGSSNY